MNTENILKLADIIAAQPWACYNDENPDFVHGYYQGCFYHSCGTAACIAGFATAVSRGDVSAKISNLSTSDVKHIAQAFLGLDRERASQLFYHGPNDASPELAAAVLRNLAATGEVDWEILS